MNAGMGGNTTDNIIFRLSAVTVSKPQKIFLMIGINDFARNRSVSYILTNYKTILNRIRSESPGTAVYVESVLPVNTFYTTISNESILNGPIPGPNGTSVLIYSTVSIRSNTIEMPTNISSEIVTLNDKLKSLAREDKMIFIDLYPSFCGPDNQLYTNYTVDGVHLTPAGYAVWRNSTIQYVTNTSQAVTFTFNTPPPAGSIHTGTIWAEYQYTAGGPWYLVRVANVTLKAV
jgi:lysophospholipase L1-like esterase